MIKNALKVVEISHGNVEDENEGHFIHANNVTRAFATFANVNVLEYATDNKKITKNGIVYQHLNTYPNGKPKESMLARYLSFDPIGLIREQYRSIKLLNEHKQQLRDADFILLQGCLLISAFWYCFRLKKRIVIDTHWINYDVAVQKKDLSGFSYRIRIFLWKTIERYMFKRAYRLLMLSETDALSAMDKLGAKAEQLILIPQAIDFQKYKTPNDLPPSEFKSHKRPIITFIGTLRSIQNRKAYDFIVKELASKFEDCDFHIYGGSKDEKIANVTVFKSRPNIMDYLTVSDILISPVDVGSGTKFKILDYLYAQRPILATSQNFDGITYALKLDGVIETNLMDFNDALRRALNQKINQAAYPENRKAVLKNNSIDALQRALKPFSNAKNI